MGNLKMTTMRDILTILIGLTLFACNDKRTEKKETETNNIDSAKIISSDSSHTDKQVLVQAKITKGDVFKPEEFQIELQGQIITADIYGHLTSGQMKKSIDIGKDFYTHKINFFDNNEQVIIFFEVTDDEGSSNDVYSLDKQTLKTIWKTDLWSFNLTVGQSEQEILYLGAGENAYALDITNGKILWQTNGLYHNYGFNYFDTISVTDNEIHLTGKSYSKEKGEIIKTAILNKQDGKIWTVK